MAPTNRLRLPAATVTIHFEEAPWALHPETAYRVTVTDAWHCDKPEGAIRIQKSINAYSETVFRNSCSILAERLHGVALGAGDDPAFLERVVLAIEARRKTGLRARVFDGVVDLVTQAERRRLCAIAHTQRAVWAPVNRVVARVEVIVVVVRGDAAVRAIAVLEAIDQRAFDAVLQEIRERACHVVIGRSGDALVSETRISSRRFRDCLQDGPSPGDDVTLILRGFGPMETATLLD